MIKNDDPITLDLFHEDDPDREFPVGFAEERLREHDGLFEFLQEKEDEILQRKIRKIP